MNQFQAITNSALWAAYGDAMGFITELASQADVTRRIGESRVARTVPWIRRVGGKFGLDVQLPAGAYSDDTQLRLSSGRAIRADGRFDVEAFAKVELPVWQAYALGAGLGTREAATSLVRHIHTWNNNFHKRYINGGGNGAAMRIQPHVWSSKTFQPSEYLPDVVRNSVVTHGHPRAWLGATFHAYVLGESIRTGGVPSLNDVRGAANVWGDVAAIIEDDPDLSDLWTEQWRNAARTDLSKAVAAARAEILGYLDELGSQRTTATRETCYLEAVSRLGATDRDSVGSGTKTSVLAYFAALLYSGETYAGVLTTANVLGTDTDTIGTMTGAILGTISDEPAVDAIQDREYIADEAARLFGIGRRHEVESFRYPDLLRWQPPEAANDAVGLFDGQPAVAGLGPASELGVQFEKSKPPGTWRWLSMLFGQTLLAKSKRDLPALDSFAMPSVRSTRPVVSEADARLPLFRRDTERREPGVKVKPSRTVRGGSNSDDSSRSVASETMHDLTRQVIERSFPPNLVGQILLDVSDGPDGIERAVAFAAIIAKARVARYSVRRDAINASGPASPQSDEAANIEIGFRAHRPVTLSGKPANLAIWLTCINHSPFIVTIDRIEIDLWFGQPMAVAQQNMPVDVPPNTTVSDLVAKAVLNAEQVEQVRSSAKDPFAKVAAYLSAVCSAGGKRFLYRNQIEREYPDIGPGINLPTAVEGGPRESYPRSST